MTDMPVPRRSQVHSVQQYRLAFSGIEAYSLRTGLAFPRHSHDQFGIGMIVDGAQRSWSCVGQVEAGVGDVIMVNPGEIHDGAPLEDKPRSWHMLYFEPRLVKQYLANELVGDPEIIHPAVEDKRLAQSFINLFRTVTNPSVSALQWDEVLLLTLSQAAERHMARGLRKPSTSACVARARQWLDDTIDSNTTLADLAALTGVSRFQLLRGFIRETGLTPHAYLLQRRVGLAKPLLARGGSLASMAHDLGFADQSHFTRAFKRQFGVTPGQYRAALH
jgi:AraC-like DNA-binding protein